MPDNDPAEGELEERVTALEEQQARTSAEQSQMRELLTQAVQNAGAARVLASAADHDVSELRSELRGQRRLLVALREDHVELRDEVRELRDEMRDGFDGMRRGFAVVNAGMEAIVQLLDRDEE